MKRLPEEYFLHAYIERGELERSHLDRVAEALAGFYLGQEPAEEVRDYGRLEQVRYNTDENFSQTEDFIGRTLSPLTYHTLRYFTDRYYEAHAGLFERRVAERRIVDGHGDLHLEHIHLTPDRLCIYDCIEFNKRFRYGDLAADLAFLAMDLDYNGCRSEERYFVRRMAERLEDPDLPRILDFYKCYRAYVKGKVKSLQSGEEEVPAAQRQQAAETATRYFDLALNYALLGSGTFVLVCMGRVGTGKSTLARHLSDALRLPVYASDRIRKEMAGVPVDRRTPPEMREELYSSGMSERTYRKMWELAARHLSRSESVILDATFSRREDRDHLKEWMQDYRASCLLIETTASDQTIRDRLRERDRQEQVVSDARLEDFEAIDRRYQPPAFPEEGYGLQVDTGPPVEATLRQLFRDLADLHIGRINTG